MRRLRRHLSPALVVSCLALLIALGGTGYAAITLPPGSVGTKQLKNGAVTASKVKVRSLLARNFRRGQLPRGPQGPIGLTGGAGPQGPGGSQGPQGAKGDPATRLFGTVRNTQSGVILGPSSGVTENPQKTATGEYSLVFNQDVGNCATLAGPAASTGNQQQNGIATATAIGGPRVIVRTFDATGASSDVDFTVAVFC